MLLRFAIEPSTFKRPSVKRELVYILRGFGVVLAHSWECS